MDRVWRRLRRSDLRRCLRRMRRGFGLVSMLRSSLGGLELRRRRMRRRLVLSFALRRRGFPGLLRRRWDRISHILPVSRTPTARATRSRSSSSRSRRRSRISARCTATSISTDRSRSSDARQAFPSASPDELHHARPIPRRHESRCLHGQRRHHRRRAWSRRRHRQRHVLGVRRPAAAARLRPQPQPCKRDHPWQRRAVRERSTG